MVTVLIVDRMAQEARQLADCCRSLTARFTEEELRCAVYTTKKELDLLPETLQSGDINCIDLTVQDGIRLAEQVRAQDPRGFILLVTSPDMSPMLYLKPSILAGSLLLRPFTPEEAVPSLTEAYRFRYTARQTGNPEEAFRIESRGTREWVPYESIRYFEARTKQVVLVTATREYPFYTTLDKLQQTLPPQFLRCHRSFIVNIRYVLRAHYNENLLYLEGEEPIPLSRSYKAAVKEVLT